MNWLRYLFGKKVLDTQPKPSCPDPYDPGHQSGKNTVTELPTVRYATGETARSGDRVIDNGIPAVVERIAVYTKAEHPTLMTLKGEIPNQFADVPCLDLMLDVGVPMIRPSTSRHWNRVVFVCRGEVKKDERA
jgi:hypothetical protein